MMDFNTVNVNGISLFYAAAGEGRPVILLHGNGESHGIFGTEILQLTEAGYRVYAVDSRGHGQSSPVTEFHYAEMAEDIYLFIKALGLDRPALFGHSDGGITGLLLAMAHPDVLGLLAVSGTNLTPEGVAPGILEEFKELLHKGEEKAAETGEQDPSVPLFRLMLTEPHIDPAELKAIRIPVLVTAGSRDLILSEETRRIADNIPDVQLVIVEEEDHGSYIEGSEILGELLLEFFRKHDY